MRKEGMLSWESEGKTSLILLMHHYFSMITESKLPWQQHLCNQLTLHSAALQLTNHLLLTCTSINCFDAPFKIKGKA